MVVTVVVPVEMTVDMAAPGAGVHLHPRLVGHQTSTFVFSCGFQVLF